MTRERRIAIQMWKDIYDEIEKTDCFMYNYELGNLKELLCDKYSVRWKHDCWFCHYVRANTSCDNEGCAKCPLMKAEMLRHEELRETECGCALEDSFFMTVVKEKYNTAKVLRAVKAIIQSLEGKRPEQVVEEYYR